MAKRLQTVGIVLVLIGLGFVVAGGIALAKVQDGYGSLQSFSAAQNVTLSYDDDGNLIDRGTTEGAEAIMPLLTEDWGFNVVESDPELATLLAIEAIDATTTGEQPVEVINALWRAGQQNRLVDVIEQAIQHRMAVLGRHQTPVDGELSLPRASLVG